MASIAKEPVEPLPPMQPRQFLNPQTFVGKLVRYRSWLIAFIILDAVVMWGIHSSSVLSEAWNFIWPGINVTIEITIVSFVVAVIIGLIVAFGRISKNIIIYNVCTFYVEMFRGLPLLVIVLIFAFVVTPAFVDFVAGTSTVEQTNAGANAKVVTPRIPFLDDFIQRLAGEPENKVETTVLSIRDIDDTWRIMFAFALTYGAFMSEVFRAGIESIGQGQMEAARSLGMNYFQAMRYVILPQAIRNVLPALANNFVFLLKDTSLASVVAVPEISHLTTQYASNRFRYPEGLLVLSFIYANLTIILSLGVYYLEARLKRSRQR